MSKHLLEDVNPDLNRVDINVIGQRQRGCHPLSAATVYREYAAQNESVFGLVGGNKTLIRGTYLDHLGIDLAELRRILAKIAAAKKCPTLVRKSRKGFVFVENNGMSSLFYRVADLATVSNNLVLLDPHFEIAFNILEKRELIESGQPGPRMFDPASQRVEDMDLVDEVLSDLHTAYAVAEFKRTIRDISKSAAQVFQRGLQYLDYLIDQNGCLFGLTMRFGFKYHSYLNEQDVIASIDAPVADIFTLQDAKRRFFDRIRKIKEYSVVAGYVWQVSVGKLCGCTISVTFFLRQISPEQKELIALQFNDAWASATGGKGCSQVIETAIPGQRFSHLAAGAILNTDLPKIRAAQRQLRFMAESSAYIKIKSEIRWRSFGHGELPGAKAELAARKRNMKFMPIAPLLEPIHMKRKRRRSCPESVYDILDLAAKTASISERRQRVATDFLRRSTKRRNRRMSNAADVLGTTGQSSATEITPIPSATTSNDADILDLPERSSCGDDSRSPRTYRSRTASEYRS